MKIGTFARALAAAIVGMAAASSAGAVTYEIKDGKLMAIRGIYGGPATQSGWTSTPSLGFTPSGAQFEILTDIEFIDGTCADIFGQCVKMDSFSAVGARTTQPLPDLLKDGTEVDGKFYNFSSDTKLINGCESAKSCTITAGILNGNGMNVNAMNFTINADGADVATGFLRGDTSTDTKTLAGSTFGRYTTYVRLAAVPEPATWAMMLVGFGMVGGAARYRRRTRTVAFG